MSVFNFNNGRADCLVDVVFDEAANKSRAFCAAEGSGSDLTYAYYQIMGICAQVCEKGCKQSDIFTGEVAAKVASFSAGHPRIVAVPNIPRDK